MAILVTGDQLIQSVKDRTFIEDGDPGCAEGVKYDFRLSPRILKASFHGPIDATKLTATEQALLVIEPGEMVFALSEERLNLPENMMAQLSPKRKLSHAGILAIGGFCIDPKYRGRLLIGLFNFSSTKFRLIPGKKVIAATFYKLEKDELSNFPEPETALEDFPDELIQVMQRYSPVSVLTMADALEKIRVELESLKTEIRSRDDWYKRFEQSLERHDKQIGDLITGLSAERETRNAGEDKLTEAIHKIDSALWWLKGAAYILTGLLGILGVPAFLIWLFRTMK